MSERHDHRSELIDRLDCAVRVARDHETRLRELRQIYGGSHTRVIACRASYTQALADVTAIMRALMNIDGERCEFCKSPPGRQASRLGS